MASLSVSVASGPTFLLIQEYTLSFLRLVRERSQTTVKFTNAKALDEVGQVNILTWWAQTCMTAVWEAECDMLCGMFATSCTVYGYKHAKFFIWEGRNGGNDGAEKEGRGSFLCATIFSTAEANWCLDMSSCHLCAFYISVEVNHELAYHPALPRSGCCFKMLFQPKYCISWCS